MAFELKFFLKQSTVQPKTTILVKIYLGSKESFVNNMDNYIVSLGQELSMTKIPQ
jgi:hypothetical protein